MSFLANEQLAKEELKIALSQRGRAGIEFLGTLQEISSGKIRDRARADFESDPEGEQMLRKAHQSNAPWDERNAAARRIAEKYPSYRFERFYQRLVAEEQWIRGIQAVEECRRDFERLLSLPQKAAGGTLQLDPALEMPAYYTGVDWHLEPGGWAGYDLYGPMFAKVCGPLVFKYGGYAAVEQGDDIIGQRMDVIRQLPKSSYARIYEPACGSASTLMCARQIFPDATLSGSDLSAQLLKMGHITAEKLGIAIDLKQRDARHTFEPDASADAVLMFAVMHELPLDVSIGIFKEAFRILKPGGDLVISDPPPFAAVDAFQAMILDWDTRHREEPFFSKACEQDWGTHLADVGFVDVQSYGMGKHAYPYINKASKPR